GWKGAKNFTNFTSSLKGSSEYIRTFPLGASTSLLINTIEAKQLRARLKYFSLSTNVISPGTTLWISLMPVALIFLSPITLAIGLFIIVTSSSILYCLSKFIILIFFVKYFYFFNLY